MASTAQERLNEKLEQEFEQTYTEEDLFIIYQRDYKYIPDEERVSFEEFKETLFEEYKDLRS